MKTILCTLLLALATMASAQPIPGEDIRDTMVRQQFKDKLDEMQRQESTNSFRLHMDHEEQNDRLDAIQRELQDRGDD